MGYISLLWRISWLLWAFGGLSEALASGRSQESDALWFYLATWPWCLTWFAIPSHVAFVLLQLLQCLTFWYGKDLHCSCFCITKITWGGAITCSLYLSIRMHSEWIFHLSIFAHQLLACTLTLFSELLLIQTCYAFLIPLLGLTLPCPDGAKDTLGETPHAGDRLGCYGSLVAGINNCCDYSSIKIRYLLFTLWCPKKTWDLTRCPDITNEYALLVHRYIKGME